MALKDRFFRIKSDYDASGTNQAKKALEDVAEEARSVPDADIEVNVDGVEQIKSDLAAISDEEVEVNVDGIERIKSDLAAIPDEEVEVEVEADEQSLAGLTAKIGAAAGAAKVGGAILEGIRDLADTGRFAEAFDIDPSQLSGLVQTFELVGLEAADVFALALAGRTAVAEAQAGDAQARNWLAVLGLTPEQAANLDMEEFLRTVIKNLGDEIDNQEFDALGKIFGETDAAFIARAHAKQYVDGFAEGFSNEEIEKAIYTEEQIAELEQRAKNAGVKAGLAITTAIVGTVEDPDDSQNWFERLLGLADPAEAAKEGEALSRTYLDGYRANTDVQRQAVVDSWQQTFKDVEDLAALAGTAAAARMAAAWKREALIRQGDILTIVDQFSNTGFSNNYGGNARNNNQQAETTGVATEETNTQDVRHGYGGTVL